MKNNIETPKRKLEANERKGNWWKTLEKMAWTWGMISLISKSSIWHNNIRRRMYLGMMIWSRKPKRMQKYWKKLLLLWDRKSSIRHHLNAIAKIFNQTDLGLQMAPAAGQCATHYSNRPFLFSTETYELGWSKLISASFLVKNFDSKVLQKVYLLLFRKITSYFY